MLSDCEPPTLELSADEMLIERVLINLIKNSMHALEHRTNARIQLRAFSIEEEDYNSGSR